MNAWAAGALGLIIGFCAGYLVCYCLEYRAKRQQHMKGEHMDRYTLALLLLLFPVAPASGATLRFAATVDGGATTFIACDQNVCGAPGGLILADTNPAVGNLTLAGGTFGPLDVGPITNIATPPFPGSPNLLSSSGIQVTNTGATDVTVNVAISATDFIPIVNTAFTTGSGTWSITALGSSIDMEWFNDPLNTQGALDAFDAPGILVDSFTSLAPSSAPFSFSHNGGPFAVSDTDPFSMTLRFDAVLTPGDSLISRGQAEIKPLAAVPMPGTWALVLLGVGLLVARRARLA